MKETKKCCECGKNIATHICSDCGEKYCRNCTNILFGHCDCQQNIISKQESKGVIKF